MKKNNYKSKSNKIEKMQTVEKIYIIKFCLLKMKINFLAKNTKAGNHQS